jgi:hypothetical protein
MAFCIIIFKFFILSTPKKILVSVSNAVRNESFFLELNRCMHIRTDSNAQQQVHVIFYFEDTCIFWEFFFSMNFMFS